MQVIRVIDGKNYEVHSNGDIYVINKKTIKGYIHRGYILMRFGGRKGFTKGLHQVLAESFILNPTNRPYINHIDGNTLNNNIANLEWVTPAENNIHRYNKISGAPKSIIINKDMRTVICGLTYEIHKNGDVFSINKKLLKGSITRYKYLYWC